jgi:hypothetical protein
MGRPTLYTLELADEICERLGEGEPLRQICRDERMPHWTTVYDWKTAHEEFSLRIARAREAGHDAIASDCLQIADDGLNDTYMDEDGNKRTDTDVIQRSKLRIETRLKLLAKWDPKRYGDRITQEHTGADGGPVQIEKIERVIVRPANPDA